MIFKPLQMQRLSFLHHCLGIAHPFFKIQDTLGMWSREETIGAKSGEEALDPLT